MFWFIHGSYIRWYLRTCCARMTEDRCFRRIESYFWLLSIWSNNRYCSLRAHLWLSYPLIYVPWEYQFTLWVARHRIGKKTGAKRGHWASGTHLQYKYLHQPPAARAKSHDFPLRVVRRYYYLECSYRGWYMCTDIKSMVLSLICIYWSTWYEFLLFVLVLCKYNIVFLTL